MALKQLKKSTIINCWRKADNINFSLNENETEEHTTLSSKHIYTKKSFFNK